jgi:hypothetical protein
MLDSFLKHPASSTLLILMCVRVDGRRSQTGDTAYAHCQLCVMRTVNSVLCALKKLTSCLGTVTWKEWAAHVVELHTHTHTQTHTHALWWASCDISNNGLWVECLASYGETSCNKIGSFVGLGRTVNIHRIWPYISQFPCQEFRICTVIYTVLANPTHLAVTIVSGVTLLFWGEVVCSAVHFKCSARHRTYTWLCILCILCGMQAACWISFALLWCSHSYTLSFIYIVREAY